MRRELALAVALVVALMSGCKSDEAAKGKEEAKKQETGKPPVIEKAPAEKPPAEQPPAEQPPAEQPPAEQPPADDAARAVAIVDQALAATGGYDLLKEKLAAWSVKSKGLYFGAPYEMTTLWQAPNKMVMAFPTMGMAMGYDDKDCWNQMHSIVKACQGDEKEYAVQSLWVAHLCNLYPLKEPGIKLVAKGEAEVGGKMAELVEVSAENAPVVVTMAFDKESHLLVRVSYPGNFAGNKGTITTTVLAHVEVAGLKLPGTTRMDLDGKAMIEDEFVSGELGAVDPALLARPESGPLSTPALRDEPAYPACVAVHNGSYQSIGATMGAVFGYLGQHNIMPMGAPTMVFIKDPTMTQDPAEYVTELRIPVPPQGDRQLPAGACEIKEIPAVTVAVQVEQGAPDKVAEKYPVLAQWVAAQGKAVAGPAQMTSYDNPMTTPPEQQTHELSFPVGEAAPAAVETPQAAAVRTFLEACSARDWEKATALAPTLFADEAEATSFKERFGALEIIRLREPIAVTGEGATGFFVPADFELASGDRVLVRVLVNNDNAEGSWVVQGDFQLIEDE